MPFRSEAQRKWLFKFEPEIAHRWAHGEHSARSNHKMPKRGHKRKAKRR